MDSESRPAPQQKRIGDLLVEAGILSAEELPKGLEYSKKTALPLGRVLIMLRCVTEEDLKAVLHVQTLMKFEGLPATLAVRALSQSREKGITLEDSLKQLGWQTDKFKGSGEPQELRELRQKLAETEERVGPEHVEIASVCTDLADVYFDHELYGQAEAAYLRALAIVEKTFGPVHLQVANVVWKMANLYFLQDRFSEAKPLYQRVLELRQNILGSTNPEVASVLHDLAELHDVQGKYADAERYYFQCITIREKYLEADDPQLIDTIKRLVYVCKRLQRPPIPISVGELLTQSGIVDPDKLPDGLEISQKSNVPLGRVLVNLHHLTEDDLQSVLHAQMLIKGGVVPAHLAIRALRYACKKRVSIEAALRDLGWTGHESGRTYELAEIMRAADELISIEKRLPAGHPDIAAVCLKLADLYATNGKFADAEMLYNRALGILENVLGGENLEIAALLDKLANVYLLQQKFAQVETLFMRALQIREGLLGKEHPDVAGSFENLARFYCAQGDHAEAGSWYEMALTIKERALGSQHPDVANIIEARANCFFDTQDYTRAEPLYWQAYKIKKNYLDTANPEITSMLTKLADLYCKEGKYSLADSVLVLFQSDKNLYL